MLNVSTKGLAVVLATLVGSAVAAGCDFYEGRWSGEFSAAGVDPWNFPPAYRGAGQVRQNAASGSFNEVAAFVGGTRVGYFSFPFAPTQVATTGYAPPAATVDPLRIEGAGTDFRRAAGNPTPVPLAYNFDPPAAGPETVSGTSSCVAPPDYEFDAFADAFPKNAQWNIFTFLPDRFASYPFGGLPTWAYRPVVAEVAVGSRDLPCNEPKSERTLLRYADEGRVTMERADPEGDGTRFGKKTGRFLAWAIIDPGSAVLRVGQAQADILTGGTTSGVTVQKYGWYGQFMVAYIDGGVIPVEDGPTVTGAPTKRMRPQRIYYPRSAVVTNPREPAGAPGALGRGYDVLQANRFTDGERYSPVCEVWTYALSSATPVAALPKSEAEILAVAGNTLEPARTTQSAAAYTPNATLVPRYVFCLQAAPLP